MRRLIAAAGVVLLAACGGSESSPAAHTSPSAPHTVTGSIALSGAANVAGVFESAAVLPESSDAATPGPAPSCAAYARGAPAGGGTFALPVVETKGSRHVYLTAEVRWGYHGPGSYTAAQLPGFTAVAVVTLQDGSASVYHATRASSLNLTVHADGSGSLSFVHWRSDEVRQYYIAGFLNGQFTWRCA